MACRSQRLLANDTYFINDGLMASIPMEPSTPTGALYCQHATIPTTEADAPQLVRPDIDQHGHDREETPAQPLQIPPLSFSLVVTGIYRSGCPMPLNFPFLAKLRLKSIIYLADQDLPTDLQSWVLQHNIRVFHFRVQQVRNSDEHEDKIENDPENMTRALEILLDRRNFPVLIHSNKGKHRSGVLVACVRKLLQNWAFSAVKLEYHYFAGEKGKTDIKVGASLVTVIQSYIGSSGTVTPFSVC